VYLPILRVSLFPRPNACCLSLPPFFFFFLSQAQGHELVSRLVADRTRLTWSVLGVLFTARDLAHAAVTAAMGPLVVDVLLSLIQKINLFLCARVNVNGAVAVARLS